MSRSTEFVECQMIYCPKCGSSTELADEAGIASLSCPSCGVVWAKFLEVMADDALWHDMVSRDKREIICPKCGYERFPSDEGTSRSACPSCHVNYIKSLLPRPIETQKTNTKACEYCGEQILSVAKKCKHCGSMLGGEVLSTVPQDAFNQDIQNLIKAGKTIEAIKRYRAETGLGLLEANFHIESLSRKVSTSTEAIIKQPVAGAVSVAAKRNKQPGMVIVAVILGIVLFGLHISNMRNPAVQAFEARQSSPAVTSSNDEASDDCYAQGGKVAIVVMANMGELAVKDVMPSQVMEEGCTRISKGSSQCKSQCVKGFKSKARDVLH